MCFLSFQNMCNCYLAAMHTDLEIIRLLAQFASVCMYVCVCVCVCTHTHTHTHTLTKKETLLAGLALKCNLTKGRPEPVPK